MQKEDYERKLGELSSRLESIETGMKSAEEKEEEKNNNENTQMEELDKLKEEMSAKFEDVCTKVEKISSRTSMFKKSSLILFFSPMNPAGCGYFPFNIWF